MENSQNFSFEYMTESQISYITSKWKILHFGVQIAEKLRKFYNLAYQILEKWRQMALPSPCWPDFYSMLSLKSKKMEHLHEKYSNGTLQGEIH